MWLPSVGEAMDSGLLAGSVCIKHNEVGSGISLVFPLFADNAILLCSLGRLLYREIHSLR